MRRDIDCPGCAPECHDECLTPDRKTGRVYHHYCTAHRPRGTA